MPIAGWLIEKIKNPQSNGRHDHDTLDLTAPFAEAYCLAAVLISPESRPGDRRLHCAM